MSRSEQNDTESDEDESSRASALEANATLLTFAYDKWFRWSAAVVFLGAVCVGLFVAKIFVASPPDIDPPFRISLLDKFQCRSLMRSAKSYAADGKVNEATTAWRSALINNPANLEAYRGTLEFLIAQPRIQKAQVSLGLMSGQNLLKRSETNHADVVLFARFLDRSELYNLSILILDTLKDDLTAEAARMKARAYFYEGDMARFGALWKKRSSELTNSSDLSLIATAWGAAWGPPAGMQAARERLAAARNDLATGAVASRLQLKVAARLLDVSLYRSALDQLTSRHEDSVSDNVGYWGLLARAGRRADAAALAKNYSRTPENALEAVRLAQVLDALDMTRYAIQFLQGQMADFKYSADLWLTLAALQTKIGDWNQVRQTAVAMRTEQELGGKLTGYSWYLEGSADVRQNREESADQSFNNISGTRFSDPKLAAEIAIGLRNMNRPKLAMEILRGLETDFAKDPVFWFELSVAAYQSHDMDVTSMASAKAYELQPENDGYANNHAAVLIAMNRDPEETVKLTLRLLSRTPGSVDRQINHALALINNRRFNDAEAALRRVPPLSLDSTEKSVLNYAWFLVHENKGNAALARKSAAEIDRSNLMPPQVDRLETGLKKLAAL
jgi:predicted Zn-dependent protease